MWALGHRWARDPELCVCGADTWVDVARHLQHCDAPPSPEMHVKVKQIKLKKVRSLLVTAELLEYLGIKFIIYSVVLNPFFSSINQGPKAPVFPSLPSGSCRALVVVPHSGVCLRTRPDTCSGRDPKSRVGL